MTSFRTGGCICGGVRYQAGEPLHPIYVCHCTECHQMTGGSVDWTASAASDFSLTQGEALLHRFTGPTSATGGERSFCSTCGTHLLFRIPDDPLLWFSANTLDDESGLQIAAHIFWHSHAPWIVADGLPKFGRHKDRYGDEDVPERLSTEEALARIAVRAADASVPLNLSSADLRGADLTGRGVLHSSQVS